MHNPNVQQCAEVVN